ncbi:MULTISPECIES: hypothetical protein [unclassified Streptomyces]|uniref:hypothetical protein n=1 Tax=unclassified Streptomyces TaxID=2593676 RepID=UPI002E0FEB7F|nr:hypothetical protein OG457_33105 [Streptomyces sp. NBC_01207]WTA21362.1 hypothetical protein OG365_26860 [Streptomyces sp. NBC_00853]
MKQAQRRGKAAAIATLAAALTLTVAAGTAQASAGGEIVGYPGPDGLIWIPELTGSSGFVSGGLSSRLDTFITFGCAGGGSIEVAFHLNEHPDRDPAPFTVDCPETDPARVTVPLGTGLQGGFGASVTASTPSIRWGATVVQPE